MKNLMFLVLDTSDGYLSVSVQVRSANRIGTIPPSPNPFAMTKIAGNRVVDKNREELIYYFHPGDLEPPLNIYFLVIVH